MTVRLARRRFPVQVALNAVIARTADVQLAALHEEVLIARHAVLRGRQDVDGAVLHLHVVATLDAVGGTAVGVDVEHALAFQFQVTFTVEAGLGGAGRAVLQRVGRSLFDAEVHTFAVGNVNRCTIRIGQFQPVDGHRTLGAAAESQRAVGAGSAEIVCYLRKRSVVDEVVGDGVALRDADVGVANRCRHILRYVAGHVDQSRVATVDDVHLVVLNCRVVGPHLANLADVVGLAHDAHLSASGKGHLARLCSRILVGHVAHRDIQSLRLCCHSDQHEGYRIKYLLHFTNTLMVRLLVFTMYVPLGSCVLRGIVRPCRS